MTGDETAPATENVIRAHPDFRMIVLANRPGFPFLGNDFFGSLGKEKTNLLPVNCSVRVYFKNAYMKSKCGQNKEARFKRSD